MNTTKTLNRNFEAIAWGALFIWWGITAMVPSLPNGTTALGIGLILIAVNVARRLSGRTHQRFFNSLLASWRWCGAGWSWPGFC